MENIFSEPSFLDYTTRQKLKKESEFIEMSEFESAFLCGLLKQYKPKSILEVGCSAGGTTALILETVLENGSEVFSVDITEKWYKNPAHNTCFVAEKYHGKYEKWFRHFGKYLPEVIESFDRIFDFCILDTVHLTPGEILDYCCIIPYMNIGRVLVIHDTNLHLYFQNGPFAFVNSMIFSASVGRKIFCKDTSRSSSLQPDYQFTALKLQ